MYTNNPNNKYNQVGTIPDFMGILKNRPHAWARINGSRDHPDIRGHMRFYATMYGVICVAEIIGLPPSKGMCNDSVLGFHIHEGGSCSGDSNDPLANTLSHFNPYECEHPYHAGDLPPLFDSGGYAFSAFLTNRFTVADIIGKTVVIHSLSDDFKSQPSGNSGVKIACGVIMPMCR